MSEAVLLALLCGILLLWTILAGTKRLTENRFLFGAVILLFLGWLALVWM